MDRLSNLYGLFQLGSDLRGIYDKLDNQHTIADIRLPKNIKTIVIVVSILLISCFSCSSDAAKAQRIMNSICDGDFDYFYEHNYDTIKNIEYIIHHYPKMERAIEKEKAYNRAKLLAETGNWIEYGGNASVMDYYNIRQAIGVARCHRIELKDKKNDEYLFIINNSLKIKIFVQNGLFLGGYMVNAVDLSPFVGPFAVAAF